MAYGAGVESRIVAKSNRATFGSNPRPDSPALCRLWAASDVLCGKCPTIQPILTSNILNNSDQQAEDDETLKDVQNFSP
jgi:hypothetical protein